MNLEEDFQQAVQHHQRGELVEARTAYERCLALNPDHPTTLINLGSLYSNVAEYSRALECLRRAIVMRPRDAIAHYNLGNALRATGALQEAVTAYQASLACNPEAAKTWHNLSLTLLAMKRYPEAIASVQRAVELDGTELEWSWGHPIFPLSRKNGSWKISCKIKMLYVCPFLGRNLPFLFPQDLELPGKPLTFGESCTSSLQLSGVPKATAAYHPLSRLQDSVKAPLLSPPRSACGLNVVSRGSLAEKNQMSIAAAGISPGKPPRFSIWSRQ